MHHQPQSAQDYSTTTMKSSDKLSSSLPLSVFNIFISFTWISISFTSILSVNSVSCTQDHGQLRTTPPLQLRALVSCSALAFFPFPFFKFVHLNIYLVDLDTQSEYCILYSGPRSTQNYNTTIINSSGKLFCSYLLPFSLSKSKYCVYYSGPQSTQDYSTTTMKSSGKLSFFLPFSVFNIFILFT